MFCHARRKKEKKKMGNGQGNVNRQIVEVISSMVVDIFLEQTVDCQLNLNVAQNITVRSVPYGDAPGVMPIDKAVESNATCVACIQGVHAYQLRVLELFSQLKQQGRPTRAFPTEEQFLEDLFLRMQGCTLMCKSTTVTEISQQQNLRVSSECLSETDFNVEFMRTLDVTLFQKMVNDKDFFANMVSAMSAMFSRGTVNEQITRLVNDVRDTIRSSSSIDFTQMLESVQNIEIIGGQGTALHNVSQNAARTYMISNVSNALSSMTFLDAVGLKVVQDLTDKNATLKDIARFVGQVGSDWIDALATPWQVGLLVAIGAIGFIVLLWLAVGAWTVHSAEKSLKAYREAAAARGAAAARDEACPKN